MYYMGPRSPHWKGYFGGMVDKTAMWPFAKLLCIVVVVVVVGYVLECDY